MTTLGIALELSNFAPSQYAGFDFNSLCVIDGVLFGFGETGIMEIGADDDNGTNIYAFFQVASTDIGVKQEKKVRSLIVSGYQKGNLIFTVIIDSNEMTEYSVSPNGELEQGSIKVDLNSDDIGRYIGLLVENVNGADFSIDAMDLLVIPTVKEPTERIIFLRQKCNFPAFVMTSAGTIGEGDGTVYVPEEVVESDFEVIETIAMNDGGTIVMSNIKVITVDSPLPQTLYLPVVSRTVNFKIIKDGVGRLTLKCPDGVTINDSTVGGTMYCDSIEAEILDLTYSPLKARWAAAGTGIWTTT